MTTIVTCLRTKCSLMCVASTDLPLTLPAAQTAPHPRGDFPVSSKLFQRNNVPMTQQKFNAFFHQSMQNYLN